MKKQNKKGFTLVELVIVIAVIAILAAVLIPTFASVQEKSKKSAALQKVRQAFSIVAINNTDVEEGTAGTKIEADGDLKDYYVGGNIDTVWSDTNGVYFADKIKADGTGYGYVYKYTAEGEFKLVEKPSFNNNDIVINASKTISNDGSDTPGTVYVVIVKAA